MRGKRGKGRTGEVADGDGDAGDGEEAEVVERAEVADDSREGRVPIQHRVLRLRRRRDVCVHLCAHAKVSSPSLAAASLSTLDSLR